MGERIVRQMLEFIGDNPDREGLRETPRRVVSAWRELFSGYSVQDAALVDLVQKSFSETNGYDQMILCRDIPFTSFCEHHILPFAGVCHIGYLPQDGRVIGLSKMPRLVDLISKRLQLQERLTQMIADVLNRAINPAGVGVVVSAGHSCVACRGIKAVGSTMVTSAVLGAFRDKPDVREEFLRLVFQGK